MTITPPQPRTLSFTEARTSFKAILDSSDRGRATTIKRGESSATIVNSEMLLNFLTSKTPANVEVVFEDDAWAMFMPGQPFATEGSTLEEATAEFIVGLREYADDWQDHLQAASNHRDNWALVQIIELSTDAQLTNWLSGTES
jgi:hypothetical protein